MHRAGRSLVKLAGKFGRAELGASVLVLHEGWPMRSIGGAAANWMSGNSGEIAAEAVIDVLWDLVEMLS